MHRSVQWLCRRCRWLVFLSRWYRIVRDRFRAPTDSFSQHGEDLLFAQLLEGADITGGVYIDVGANQPTHGSNTYRLYRQGLHGILIEPDDSNAQLLRRVRPKDIVIEAVVGATAGISRFCHHVFSVLSSLEVADMDVVRKTEYLPRVTVDNVVATTGVPWVYLLSVDTEGNDLEVLKGAERTLRRTFLVCVEANANRKKAKLTAYLERHGFELRETAAVNLIFQKVGGLDAVERGES